jgi:hypothetical protein
MWVFIVAVIIIGLLAGYLLGAKPSPHHPKASRVSLKPL